MPVVASGSRQAWVRVSPPRKKVVDPANALLGPLFYFSCRPVDPIRRVRAPKQQLPIYPPDLLDAPVRRPTRAVSAPQSIEEDYDEDRIGDEEEPAEEEYTPETRSPPPRRAPAPVGSRPSPHQPRSGPTGSNYQSPLFQSSFFQPRQSQQQQQQHYHHHHRSPAADGARSSYSLSISSSWSNATKPLDLG